MIKVTVMYPNQEGSHFDHDYWTGTHFPLLSRLLGPALTGAGAEKGLGGPVPGSPALYTAIAHLYFDSLDSFQASFAPVAAEVLGDLANFTDVSPVIQISAVLV